MLTSDVAPNPERFANRTRSAALPHDPSSARHWGRYRHRSVRVLGGGDTISSLAIRPLSLIERRGADEI